MEIPLKTFELDFSTFFWTAMFSVVVFLGIQLAFKIIIPLIFKGSAPKWLAPLQERIIRIAILALSLILVFTLVKTDLFAGTLLVVILVGGTWNYVRNFMSGLMILFVGEVKPGNKIESGDNNGMVVSLGKFSLTLRKDNGETVSLPYSRLAELPLVSKAPSETAIARTIIIEQSDSEDSVVKEQRIKHQLAISPWVLAFPAPIVESKTDRDGRITFSVTVFGIEEEHLKHVERALLSAKLQRA